MSTNLSLAPEVKALALREAGLLLNEVEGVTSVVVATIDGFDVASAVKSGDAARIAAMASSISAIGSVVSEEAELGLSKSVTIDTESGFAIVYGVSRSDTPLIISVVATRAAILGQVTYRTAQLAASLASA